MNCLSVKALLDDYLTGALADPLSAAVDEHCSGCEACRSELGQLRSMRQALRQSIRVAAPDDKMFRRLVTNAVATHSSSVKRVHRGPVWISAGIGGLLAASLLLVLINIGVIGNENSSARNSEDVVIAMNNVNAVDIAIFAPRDLVAVEITVQIAGDLELDGFKGQRDIRWTADLAKGTNKLSLPIIARGSDGGRVVVSLAHGGGVYRFEVNAHVDPNHIGWVEGGRFLLPSA